MWGVDSFPYLLWHMYMEFYWCIHHWPSYLVNRLVIWFNRWWNYFYISQSQFVQYRQRRGLILNIFRIHHFYISTSYICIWYFHQLHSVLTMQWSPKLQSILVAPLFYTSSFIKPKVRLGDPTVPYITFESLIWLV